MSEWDLDETARDAILQRDILPIYFPTDQPSENPTVVVLAAQQGAGRSRASSRLLDEHGDAVAILSTDDLRAFHSQFAELSRSRAPEASAALAQAAADWTRDIIRFARENRRSLVLEGTFPDPVVVAATAARFADEGFQTRAVVVGSRRAESLLSVLSHYLRDVHAKSPAQLTSREAHDRGFEATRGLVAAVEDEASVERLTVLGREGRVVFDARRTDGADAFRGAGAALVAAQSARMDRLDATQWLSELHHATDFAASSRDLPREVAELLVDLHETALREVIPELHVPADGTFATAMEQRTVARLVALRRTLTPTVPVVDVAAPVVTPTGPERGGVSR